MRISTKYYSERSDEDSVQKEWGFLFGPSYLVVRGAGKDLPMRKKIFFSSSEIGPCDRTPHTKTSALWSCKLPALRIPWDEPNPHLTSQLSSRRRFISGYSKNQTVLVFRMCKETILDYSLHKQTWFSSHVFLNVYWDNLMSRGFSD